MLYRQSSATSRGLVAACYCFRPEGSLWSPKIESQRLMGENMRFLHVVVGLFAVSVLGSCATRASAVAPLAISSAEFAHLNCVEGRAQLANSRERENALTRQQNNAATADAAGVFLFLVPLGSVVGSDVSGELAQVKGEVNALERHVAARCAAEAQALQAPGVSPN